MNRRNEKRKIEYLPYLILALSAAALFIRAFYSFCWSDESFYFSTTERFLRGDAIFVHEWFPTQLVSLILLPFQWLYEAVSGSTTGVILYFRILYVLLSFGVAVFIYNTLKDEYGRFCSLCGALFYQYYTHLNIATMSYYTLSYTNFLVSMLLLYRGSKEAEEGKGGKVRLILAGTCFALAVLSLPSLAVAYFVCAALFFVFCIFRRKYFPVFWWSLLGIVIPAGIVLCYVLPTSGLSGILENLPYVLSDEEHTVSLVYPFKNFFLSVTAVLSKAVYVSVLLALLGFAKEAVRHVSKGSSGNEKVLSYFRKATLFVWIIDILLFVFYMIRGAGHTGFIGTAFVLFSVPLYFWTEKRNRKLFGLLVVSGMIFSMTYSYSSLCDLYVLCIGHNVAAVGGFMFVRDFLRELWEKSGGENTASTGFAAVRVLSGITIAIVIAVVLQTMTLRFVNVYRDAPIGQLTARVEQGPAAGLYTTPEHKQSYDAIYSAIKLCEKPGKKVFFTKLLPWGYLATDMECAAPTTWRTLFSSDRLRLYYEVRPEKIPDVIFVLPKEAGSYDSCGDVEADPIPNANEEEGWLLNYVNQNSYTTQYVNGIAVRSRDS